MTGDERRVERIGVTFTVNGRPVELTVDSRATLLDTLRETLGLTGTKKGCDHGQCGACTVHVDGRRVNSCLSFAAMHEGSAIDTIEGLGTPDGVTSGAVGIPRVRRLPVRVLHAGPNHVGGRAPEPSRAGRPTPTSTELMSGNICRCGAYQISCPRFNPCGGRSRREPVHLLARAQRGGRASRRQPQRQSSWREVRRWSIS